VNFCPEIWKFYVKPAWFTYFSYLIRDLSIGRILKYERTKGIIKPVTFRRKINSEKSFGLGYCALSAANQAGC
jgi:hypothetical protein